MATSILFLNDRDIQTDFSFLVDGLAGWPGQLASAPRTVPLLDGPEMAGSLIDPRLIRLQAGRATLTGRIEAASTALAMTALDALRATLGEGEVRVRSIYAPDRECYAILETHDGAAYQKELVNGLLAASFSFTVKDGVAYRLQPDGYALSTARTSCPIGTAHSLPVVLLHGGGGTMTNPTVTVRNAAGESVQSMGFTVALGANDFLRVDSARGTIDLSTAGVVTDGMSLWTSGDFLVLRPADCWVEAAVYPTIEVSVSAGTAKGGVNYPRSFR